MPWRPAIIIENKEIARASRLLLLKPADDLPVVYQPGNVLSLSCPLATRKQTHAYTVSFADPVARTFAIIYRVIPEGRMTPTLEKLTAGDTSLSFEGVYHQPILQEISDSPRAVIGISTGTGIGPLYGFARQALTTGAIDAPIRLYAGFREEADICLRPELDSLAAEFPRFTWQPTLSLPHPAWKGLRGRVTASVPAQLGPLADLHFHLVGNGAMLAEFWEALTRAGVPETRLSSETYFNWEPEPDEATMARMAAEMKKALPG